MAKNSKNKNQRNKNKNMQYNNKRKEDTTSLGIKKVLFSIFFVILVIGCAYLLTLYLTDKGKRSAVATPEARIQYEIILAGESFSQNSKDYIVVYYDEKDMSVYSEVFSSYSEKEGKPKLYKCYTNEALNKKFVGDEENRKVRRPQDLKVKENTLIHFKDHQVVDYITGSEDIISYIESL